MLENLEQKRPVKFKSIFRQKIDTNQASFSRKSAAHLKISPPILQHSTSILSLVSPTRISLQNENAYELYQPLSAPPPIPQHKSPYAANTPTKANFPHRQLSTNDTKQNSERPLHALEGSQQQQMPKSNTNPMRHADVRRTVASDPRVAISNCEETLNNRRHSCSSTLYKAAEKEANNSSKFITRKGRRSGKVGTWSPSAASIEPCASKSTPHKVKIYNVQEETEDVEKQRKMQELEDLITGRRGSTLKLSLTPKGLS